MVSHEWKRRVAPRLAHDADVLLWYRNKVGRNSFAIQGFLRHRIHPDFVVQQEHEGKTVHRVLVIETKGPQLKGSENTEYKRKVADYFTKAGKKVTWQQLGEGFKDHLFRFQILDEAQQHGVDWQDKLRTVLAAEV
jgi:type III restriction enzyme